MKKRKNECLICTSRKCNHRIVSVDDGNTYDEIACRKHVRELYKHSDENASGIGKHHIETTGTLCRGECF